MTNKYLEKIAETSVFAEAEQAKNRLKNTAAGAGIVLGAANLISVPGEILGYHNVYHGTNEKHLETINKTGLNPDHGGKVGGSSVFEDNRFSSMKGVGKTLSYENFSKGKVHVTKEYLVAKGYASNASQSLESKYKPVVVSAKVSHRHWEQMRPDPLSFGGKDTAATTKHTVRPSAMEGKQGFNTRSFATEKNLNRYLSQVSGRKRFATGVARAALSSVAIAGGTSYFKNKIIDKIKAKK